MIQFMIDNILTLIFGISAAVTSWLALKYKINERRLRVESNVEKGRHVSIFLTRESMLEYLLAMYEKASKGDIIWGQCVGCRSYTGKVKSTILEAAGRGVQYKIIVNSFAPTLADFRALYDPLKDIELVEGHNNTIRVQGLSEREIVLAFPGVDTYTGILIKDPHFVKIVKKWFDKRFEELKQKSKGTVGSKGFE